MKKVKYSLIALLCCISTYIIQAQKPNNLSYQAVLRNVNNTLMINIKVGMRISIIKGSEFGPSVYVETQNAKTNMNGLISLQIGAGEFIYGNYRTIDWSEGPYFLKTEIDPFGGTDYTIISVQQILSVPFSMYADHAKFADTIIGDIDENDPIFSKSVAQSITRANISAWNNKVDSTVESDPIFMNWNKSYHDLSAKPSIGDSIRAIANGSETKLTAGQHISITGTGTLASPYSIQANNVFTHYIGEYFEGGIVFHLYRDSVGIEHGLIVSHSDLSMDSQWSSIDTLIGNNGKSTWNGFSNTQAISNDTTILISAAKACKNLVQANYSDWYLPSIDELYIMFSHRFDINRRLSQVNGSQLIGLSYYWSSTELDKTDALSVNTITGVIAQDAKSTMKKVRAIRKY